MRYQTKPIQAEAFRLPEVGDDSTEPFLKWCEENRIGFVSERDESVAVWRMRETVANEDEPTRVLVEPGEWIVLLLDGDNDADDDGLQSLTHEEFVATFEEPPVPTVDYSYVTTPKYGKLELRTADRKADSALLFLRGNAYVLRPTEIVYHGRYVHGEDQGLPLNQWAYPSRLAALLDQVIEQVESAGAVPARTAV